MNITPIPKAIQSILTKFETRTEFYDNVNETVAQSETIGIL